MKTLILILVLICPDNLFTLDSVDTNDKDIDNSKLEPNPTPLFILGVSLIVIARITRARRDD